MATWFRLGINSEGHTGSDSGAAASGAAGGISVAPGPAPSRAGMGGINAGSGAAGNPPDEFKGLRGGGKTVTRRDRAAGPR